MPQTHQVWLVDRDLEDGRMITLTYATDAGDRYVTRQRSLASDETGVPASIEVDKRDLRSVDDSTERDRLKSEVERVRTQHDPGDHL